MTTMHEKGAGSVPDDLVEMGYVAGVFGVRGSIKVVADTEFADSLLDYKVWWLGREGVWKAYHLEEGEVHAKHLAARLQGIVDRDVAFGLRGCKVAIPRSLMPAPQDDEYYWADLIGLTVVNRQGESLGKVEKLFETGANDVLVVNDGVNERLIPFVGPVIDQVDIATRMIRVDWGLDY